MINYIKNIWFWLKKLFMDLILTMYDDQEYKVMSLPRVSCVVSGICVIISWIADQFLGIKYGDIALLIGWNTTSFGAYAVKKYVNTKTENNNRIVQPPNELVNEPMPRVEED